MKRKVTISQCMIVKNEEKNIRKALSWGKGIVCEQIVVDTGSTDKTREIAESMGAKVLSFPWIDDFSAAKNFAIGQAKGDWIAFLDADEYYNEKDAKKLFQLVQRIGKQPEFARKDIVIQCAWIHLDDKGEVFDTSVQDRIFKNSPSIRYKNRIHESLEAGSRGPITYINAVNLLSIFHTGYANTSYQETGKAERNVRMLLKEVEENAHNYDAWSYLGEAYLAAGQPEAAKQSFQKAIMAPTNQISEQHLTSAYINLMKAVVVLDPEDGEKELMGIKDSLPKELMVLPDFDYWLGMWYHMHQRDKEAAVCFENVLIQLDQFHDTQLSSVPSQLKAIYQMLMEIYYASGEKQRCVKECVFILRLAPQEEAALKVLLTLFASEPGSADNPTPVYQFLEKFYNFSDFQTKLFVMKAAKAVNFFSLYDLLLQSLSEKEQKCFFAKAEDQHYLSYEQFQIKYPDILCRNEADRWFLSLMERIGSMDQEAITEWQKRQVEKLSERSPEDYKTFISYFSRFPSWGGLDPQNKNFETLCLRSETLKLHQPDFLWLYQRLSDNRSRAVLAAVLKNWIDLDEEAFARLENIKERSSCYFDTDIIPTGIGETFVDLGAYTGDTVQEFIKTYGEDYKKIYCYEAAPDTAKVLESNTKNHSKVEVRPVAAWAYPGSFSLARNQQASENRVLQNGEPGVKAVTIDEDIIEPVTFIKMNLVGGEQEALRGCRRHILEEHPKLVISTYYGYENIWKIPRMIDEMDPSYHFFMRHYGGNLIPTKFVLYAI